jgi:hypothetical protein
MLASLVLAFALQPTPPVTHHFVLHTGGHAIVKLSNARLHDWSLTRGGIVSIADIRTADKNTTLRITASSPGATAINVGCDGGHREVWLVDVR